jgi:hypothetical protein
MSLENIYVTNEIFFVIPFICNLYQYIKQIVYELIFLFYLQFESAIRIYIL